MGVHIWRVSLAIAFAVAIRTVSVATAAAAPLSKEEAVRIFVQVENREPRFCGAVKNGDRPSLFCAYERKAEIGDDTVVTKLERFAGTWQQASETVIPNGAEGEKLQKDFEIVKVGKEKALYFSRELIHQGTAYNGVGEAEFILCFPDREKYLVLHYSGKKVGDRIDGKFENLPDFAKKPAALKVLEVRAKKSKLIYHPSRQDLDINNVTNLDKKWLKENPDAYQPVEGGWTEIVFPYYDQNLFARYASSGNEPVRKENRKYIVQTSFAGPVLGFDKKAKKYFVIWVPQGMGVGGAWGARSYNLKLARNSIVVLDNDYHTVEIDLDRKLYRLTSKAAGR